MDTTNTFDPKDIETGKTNAILAYCTPIGWIIAYVLHSNAKTKFAAFHLRQGLGIMILAFGLAVISFGMLFILPLLFWLLRLVNVAILILAVLGIINAANGKAVTAPIVGDTVDKMLSGIN